MSLHIRRLPFLNVSIMTLSEDEDRSGKSQDRSFDEILEQFRNSYEDTASNDDTEEESSSL